MHQVGEVAEEDVQAANVEFEGLRFSCDAHGEQPDACVLENETLNHGEKNRHDEGCSEVDDCQSVKLVPEVVAVP